MPSAYALGIVSRNSILDFGVAERLRAFRYSFFTGGVVMENGRCSAASYGSATLRTFPTIAARNKKAIVFASLHQRWLRIGAADEARTRYLHLGKVALYQMSYGRILHVASRGVAPGDVDYYTASRGRCQHPICIFCNFWGKRPTFGPASCNLQFQTSPHHVIGRPMTIQFRSGSAPLMRRKLICIPHRELL